MSNGLGTNEKGSPVMGCAVPNVAPVKPAKPKEKVDPIITPAKFIVAVRKFFKDGTGASKAYTTPKRQAVVIKTNKAFNGSGTLTWSDNIKLFKSSSSNDQVKLNGKDNVFKGALLSGGITLYAEGARPSAALDDGKLTLQLSGGNKINGPDATATATSVEVTLDICKGRPGPGVAPPPLSQDDKVQVGRNLLVQDAAGQFERAQLIIQQVKPSTFRGALVLTARGHVTAFTNEKHTAGETEALPYTIPDASKIPAGGDKNLWAEGKSPSADVLDSGFIVTVQGIEADRVNATSVHVLLDICQSRKVKDTEPGAMSADDKLKIGRFLHEQDTKAHHGRALLVVRKIKPDKFKGTLVLDGVNTNKVELFPTELKKAGELATPLSHEIQYDPKDPKKKNEDKKFWLEGKTGGVSGALRDVSLFVHLKEDNPTNADTVRITVVTFTDLKADIPSTPEVQKRKSRTGGTDNNPVPRHTLTLAGGATVNDYDHDFNTNVPLVLIEGSVKASDKIKLSVKIAPAAAAPLVSWSILRDRRAVAPQGDADAIVKLPGNSDDPGLVQDAAKKLEATLTANAVGSFHLQPFIDNNHSGKNEFDDDKGNRIDREPYICMNIVLVRVQGAQNLTKTKDDTKTSTGASSRDIVTTNNNYFGTGPLVVPRRVNTGDFGNASNNNAIKMRAIVRVIGGGHNGKRGLDQVFSGWLNNELNAATSPVAGSGEDVTHTFQKRLPAPNPSARTRCFWKMNGAEVKGPMLDSGAFGAANTEGTGGNTCTSTNSTGNDCPVVKKDHKSGIGQNWDVSNVDSPGGGILLEHPADTAIAPATNRRTVRNFKFNIDFRCALIFWTNRDKVSGPVDKPACRLYSTVSTNSWTIRLESNFDDTFVETRVVRKKVDVVKDVPTRLAIPVDGTGLETRAPDGLDHLVTDIPF
jgi:hypothetical protein